MTSQFSIGRRTSLALVLAGASLLAGCKDSEVESRLAASRQLRDQTQAFEKALTSSASDAELAAELKKMASTTAQLGGSKEQKAIASLLASKMSGSSGLLFADTARDLERNENNARALIIIAAESASTLQSVADAQSKLSLGDSREKLKDTKAQAQAKLKDFQARFKELENPVNQLKQSLADRHVKLDEMQKRADDLRREALAVSAMEAFPKVEESADVKTRGAQLRASVALDEAQMLTMQPELKLANDSINAAQSLSQASEAALQAIENYSTSLQEDGTKLAKAADDLRKQAEAQVAALAAERDGALKDAYQSAQEAFNAAFNDAGKASSSTREMGAAAAQVKLDATIALAALSASRVSGIDAQINLHQQLAAAGTLFGGAEKQKAAIESLETERKAVFEEAKTQYTAALDSVGAMNVESPAVARMQASLKAALASLDPESQPAPVVATKPTKTAAPTPEPTPSVPSNLTPIGHGFPSQTDLIASFQGGNGNIDTILDNFQNGFAYSMPEGKKFVEHVGGVIDAVIPLHRAVKEKFGAESATAFSQVYAMTMSGGGLGQYELINEKTAPTLRFKGLTDSGPIDFKIVQVKNGWYLDADAIAATSNKNIQKFVATDQASLDAGVEHVKTGFADVARRIKAGELDSYDDLVAALQEVMKGVEPIF